MSRKTMPVSLRKPHKVEVVPACLSITSGSAKVNGNLEAMIETHLGTTMLVMEETVLEEKVEARKIHQSIQGQMDTYLPPGSSWASTDKMVPVALANGDV